MFHFCRCIEEVTKGVELWNDRHYAFTSAPSDILGGLWTYAKGPLDHGACPKRGGFRGTINATTDVAICCANHCGKPNLPTVHTTAPPVRSDVQCSTVSHICVSRFQGVYACLVSGRIWLLPAPWHVGHHQAPWHAMHVL